jgi:hypothetical protein
MPYRDPPPLHQTSFARMEARLAASRARKRAERRWAAARWIANTLAVLTVVSFWLTCWSVLLLACPVCNHIRWEPEFLWIPGGLTVLTWLAAIFARLLRPAWCARPRFALTVGGLATLASLVLAHFGARAFQYFSPRR